MFNQQHYDRLEQRMKWLTIRAAGKAELGWENNYDLDERDSLALALPILKQQLIEGKVSVPVQ